MQQFEAAYQRQMKTAYTWDLWGAAYLINGGASDDVFTNAVAEPDSLASVISGQGEE